MSSIQVVGHVCVDLIPRLLSGVIASPGELAEVGPMDISVGGAVGNCGRVLAALGVEVSLSASVGDDELGVMCRRILQERHGDDVELTVVPGTGTSYSVVVEPQGTDRSFWHHTGANDVFGGECAITAERLVHFGYPSLTPAMCTDHGGPIVRLFDRAHAQGVATSLDLAFLAANSPLRSVDWADLFRTVLPSADVFCPSWDDLVSSIAVPPVIDRRTVEEWADTFLHWGAGIILITLGRHGAFLRVAPAERLGTLAACGLDSRAWAGMSTWVAAGPVDAIVTTNGAGDTYKAAFLAALVDGAGPADCLASAREVVGRHIGGRPLIPLGGSLPAPRAET